LRIWVASSTARKDPEVLGSFIAPDAYDDPTAVAHVHVVPPDAVAAVTASIAAGAYPAESHYVPVLLKGLDELLDNLPLVSSLGSSDQLESLMAWLQVWTFIDEDGRTRTLAEALWPGQRRLLEALLVAGHVLSVKSRKVGLSTLVCAHAAWTARIRDRNASVHLLSYRADAAQELLRSLRRGLDGLPSFLRLPLERETSTVLTYAAGPGDIRSLKAFPATPNSAIEATTSHLVLDEWAHTFDPEALWGAVEPTLAPRATWALITTPVTPTTSSTTTTCDPRLERRGTGRCSSQRSSGRTATPIGWRRSAPGRQAPQSAQLPTKCRGFRGGERAVLQQGGG
jgi:hypothetical protein